jgi:two-component system response regulator DesR
MELGMATPKIRVLLAEDQTMLRGALAALLSLEPDITVVAEATNGNEALKLIQQHAPDVVVTDIEMPQRTGLELAATLQSLYATSSPGAPRLDSETWDANTKPHPYAPRVIILTTFARPGYLRRALDAGARGYLLKERPASELADAIRKVHAGLRAIDPALAAEAWAADPDPLSDRERQILQRAGDGRTSAEIAADLHLSEGTVRNYLSEAIAKLGATNRTDAARIARSRGWL